MEKNLKCSLSNIYLLDSEHTHPLVASTLSPGFWASPNRAYLLSLYTVLRATAELRERVLETAEEENFNNVST